MKSIEELLEIIKGVDMDLWDNVEQEAYDEILSRFAGKDARLAELEKENERLILKNNWYHEEHAKEMNKRIELEKYRMFFEIWQKKI